MIQKIFGVFLLLSFTLGYAQENTSSQYSLHGIGIKRFRGTVANTSAGGVSLFFNATTPSILNPSSYADLKQTSFAAGGSFTSTKLEGNDGSVSLNNATFDYLSISIPAKVLGFGFGIVPHSSVGNELVVNSENGDRNESQGKGDVNRVYFGAGAKIYKGFKVGAELRYNFGRLENALLTIPASGEARQIIEQTDVAGFTYVLSGTYDFKIKDKYLVRASYVYEGSGDHKFSNVQESASVRVNPQSEPTVDPSNRDFIDAEDREFNLPTVSTFGLALIKENKWSIGGEGFISRNGDFKDRFRNRSLNNDAEFIFKDGIGVRVGGQIVPNVNSLTSYLSRVDYRVGFRYENLGLQINNTEINEFGISFGLGLPLPKGYSNLDLGFEFGSRGENTSDTIKEQFINFRVGLSLSDKWFRKRKYN